MMESKRKQRRKLQKLKLKQRVNLLIERYEDSNGILKIINKIKKKPIKSAIDIKDLENFEIKYKILKKHELNGGEKGEEGDGNNISNNSDIKVVNLNEKSVFYDPELNPLGKQPFDNIRNEYINKSKKRLPFKSNLDNNYKVNPPVKDKPLFYKIKGVQDSYSYSGNK